MTSQITVTEATDLGDGNFLVRLKVGNSENEIARAEVICAATCDEAVEKAKDDFVRWLKKVFKVATNRAA